MLGDSRGGQFQFVTCNKDTRTVIDAYDSIQEKKPSPVFEI